MEPFWTSVDDANLRQGDLLPGCWFPQFPADFADQTDEARETEADQADLIVITQSCDLEHGNVSLVALCPIWSIPAFEVAQASHGRIKSPGAWCDYWNNVRKGRSPTLHLLASPTVPSDPRAALVVDFRAIYSLPYNYLIRHMVDIGARWRLRSPLLEHFSQAFARSFIGIEPTRASHSAAMFMANRVLLSDSFSASFSSQGVFFPAGVFADLPGQRLKLRARPLAVVVLFLLQTFVFIYTDQYEQLLRPGIHDARWHGRGVIHRFHLLFGQFDHSCLLSSSYCPRTPEAMHPVIGTIQQTTDAYDRLTASQTTALLKAN